jgi:hypothetical protein
MSMKKTLIPLLIVLALLFSTAAVAGSSKEKRYNSSDVSEPYQNPNTYLFALLIDGKILDGRFTNIRFQPYKTAVLFDESVLFCGDVTEQFDGKTGPVVVTYLTRAAGKYQGIGCHELLSVFQVIAPKGGL